jgi:hypothetical protein
LAVVARGAARDSRKAVTIAFVSRGLSAVVRAIRFLKASPASLRIAAVRDAPSLQVCYGPFDRGADGADAGVVVALLPGQLSCLATSPRMRSSLSRASPRGRANEHADFRVAGQLDCDLRLGCSLGVSLIR